ncbi:MAG: hypothetical protein KBC21_01535 [Candidatus Pacebacteria bacterium]|nr:hypothetical protein [Candidatus Paceibacterota bacterium]
MRQTITISKNTLLLPYILSFLLLGVALCDMLFFDGFLLSILPVTATGLFLYYIFFEFPHIIASFFMFLEKEYRSAYKVAVYKKLLTLVVLGIILLVTHEAFFYSAVIIYTLYHVVRQQFGVSKFYGTSEGYLLNGLLVSSVAVGSIAFFSTIVPINGTVLQSTSIVGLLGVLIFILFGKESRRNLYLLFFMLSFACSAFLFGMGYILLGLLSIRIVHDITAFIFYGVHNHNRKKDGHNILFNLPLLKTVSPLILTVVFALTINLFYIYLVSLFRDTISAAFMLTAIYYIVSVMHYFTESKVWKRGSLARNYIHIT